MRQFKLTRGYITSVKPLVRCLYTFANLQKLELSYIVLNRLHYMAIDNYLITTPTLRSLKLIGVKMTHDDFLELSSSLEMVTNLQTLDISHNKLLNSGCRELANILLRNKSLRKVSVSRNGIKEEGIILLLNALKSNKTITTFRAEANKFAVTRRTLALIGNLVVYDNNTLEVLQLGGGKQGLLQDEFAEWDHFDDFMIQSYIKEVQAKSNIKLLSI